MPMKLKFVGTVPKDFAHLDSNEDAYGLDFELKRFAVGDGASESYDSKTWARMLVDKFISEPAISQGWLDDAANDYLAKFDQARLSWSQLAAFERGSFATLLGVTIADDSRTARILGIGDSIAVLLDGEAIVDSFPYKQSPDFQQRPELFSTSPAHNMFLSASNAISRYVCEWQFDGLVSPMILCMTDALGEWALRNVEEGKIGWSALSVIEDQDVFEALIVEERRTKNMRIDDSTLITLTFSRTGQDELPLT